MREARIQLIDHPLHKGKYTWQFSWQIVKDGKLVWDKKCGGYDPCDTQAEAEEEARQIVVHYWDVVEVEYTSQRPPSLFRKCRDFLHRHRHFLITMLAAVAAIVMLICMGCTRGRIIKNINGRPHIVEGTWYHKTIQPVQTPQAFNEQLRRDLAKARQQLKLQKEAQELREQRFCRLIMFCCLAAAAISAVLAYITKKVGFWAGLALLLCAEAFVMAIIADILTWVHSIWFLPALLILAGSFYALRKFSIIAWLKNKVQA